MIDRAGEGSEGTGTHLPVFVLSPATDMAAELGLPAAASNLFQRLIRNPHAESDRAKERECAEMLCALLQNAPTLRRHLLGWMAGPLGFELERLDGLRYELDTEQAVGSKRDDLRIVGWRLAGDDDEEPALLWTVEVKVGASFHQSGPQLAGQDAPVADEDHVPVNQLLNYDHWLARQPAGHRAGFVLALHDCAADLPERLLCPWRCLSWTRLGEEIASAIRAGELTEGEQLLARHALGFIRENLWRTTEMSDTRLDYNDVSLIRAFAALAKQCEARVNRLLEPVVEVIEKSGIGKGEVGRTPSLFKGTARSDVYRELASDSWLYAGIGGDSDTGEDFLSVWIETPSKHPQKPAFKASLRSAAERLRKRNPKWTLPSQDAQSGWSAWDDVVLIAPLASLLVADDQEKAVCDFVGNALDDLKKAGVIEAFNRTIGGGVNHRGNK